MMAKMKALVATIVLISMSVSTNALAQTGKQKRVAPGQTIEVVCGGGWLMGRVVSADPDLNIRSSLIREWSIFGAYPGRALPGAKMCIS